MTMRTVRQLPVQAYPRDGPRDAWHFFGAADVVGQRDSTQLTRAIGLGRIATDPLREFGIAAVDHVEWIRHPDHRAGEHAVSG
jgi:hypothetical protein